MSDPIPPKGLNQSAQATWQLEQLLASLAPGDSLPSERQMAIRWAVDRWAVGRAVSACLASGHLARSGRRLILQGEGRGKQESSRQPGYFLCLTTMPEVAQYFRAASRRLHLEVEVECSKNLLEQQRQVLHALHGRRPCLGVVSCPAVLSDELYRGLRERGIACVVHGRPIEGVSSASISTETLMKDAMAYLAKGGYSKLLLLAEQQLSSIKAWEQQARLQARLAGLEIVIRPLRDRSAREVAAAGRHARRLAENTAVVCIAANTAARFAVWCREQQLSIPKDLGLIHLRKGSTQGIDAPPITHFSNPEDAVPNTTLALAALEAEHFQNTGDLPSPVFLSMAPRLVEHGTCRLQRRAQRFEQKEPPARSRPQSLGEQLFFEPERDRLEAAARFNATGFRPPANGPFLSLDLRRRMNRNHARMHGWLGKDPLQHLPVGLHYIHGLPFELIEPATPATRTSIVLKASKGRSRNAGKLPRSVTLPIGRRVKAVYLLHACGYAEPGVAYGEMDFCLEDAGNASVILQTPKKDELALSDKEIVPHVEGAAVQDWWPRYRPFENAQVKPFVVTADGDPSAYERYLYVLRWENPDPDSPLTRIRIRVFPETKTVHAILAITLETA